MKRALALLLACFFVSVCLPAPAEQPGFSGAVFVGDSIMQQIGRYKMEQGERGRAVLEGARFLAISSYSLYQGSRITPAKHKPALRLGGSRVSLPDALYRMEARQAYVMLGMNDQAGSQLDSHIQMYTRLIERVQKRNPGLKLIALSVTPIYKGAQTKMLNQKNFNAFNERLEKLCGEMGVSYLDVASALMNEEGFLKQEYTADNRVHLSQEGMAVFVAAIEAFARGQTAP